MIMFKRISWSDNDIENLRYLFVDENYTIEEVSKIMGRTISSIKIC